MLDKQLMQYLHAPKYKWRTLQNCSKFQSQTVHFYGYVFHDTNGPNHGQTLKTQWFLSNEICTDTCRPLVGKDNSRTIHWYSDRKKVPNWKCLFVHRKHGLFLSENVHDIKMAGRKQKMAPMWKKLMGLVDRGEPTSFLDHVNFGCTQRECKPNETIVDEYRKMLEPRMSAEATEKMAGVGETSRKNCRVVLRHGRSCEKVG